MTTLTETQIQWLADHGVKTSWTIDHYRQYSRDGRTITVVPQVGGTYRVYLREKSMWVRHLADWFSGATTEYPDVRSALAALIDPRTVVTHPYGEAATEAYPG